MRYGAFDLPETEVPPIHYLHVLASASLVLRSSRTLHCVEPVPLCELVISAAATFTTSAAIQLTNFFCPCYRRCTTTTTPSASPPRTHMQVLHYPSGHCCSFFEAVWQPVLALHAFRAPSPVLPPATTHTHLCSMAECAPRRFSISSCVRRLLILAFVE